MSDREWFYLSATVIALAVLWYAATHRTSALPSAPAEASGALPTGWDQPMNDVFNANPGANLPPTPGGLITVNVNNPLPSMLSDQYIPMFGFVGMAQGALYD